MSDKKPMGFVSGLKGAVDDFVREVKQDLRDMTPPEAKKPLISSEALATVKGAQSGLGTVEIEGSQDAMPGAQEQGPERVIDPWALVDTPGRIQIDAAFIAENGADDVLRYAMSITQEVKAPQTMAVVFCDGGKVNEAVFKALRIGSRLFGGVGWGPRSLEKDVEALDEKLTTMLNDNPRMIAVGPLGLDEPYAPYKLSEQVAQMKVQLEIAADFGLPALVAHRRSFEPLRKALCEMDGLPRLIWAEPPVDEDEVALVNELGARVLVRTELTHSQHAAYRQMLLKIPEERRLLAGGSSLVSASSRSGHPNGPEGLPLTLKAYAALVGVEQTPGNLKELQAKLNRNARRVFVDESKSGE